MKYPLGASRFWLQWRSRGCPSILLGQKEIYKEQYDHRYADSKIQCEG